jgi:hypothetical protein
MFIILSLSVIGIVYCLCEAKIAIDEFKESVAELTKRELK